MAEYRLEDLARASGVSARNIRAYRERGLLDAPRRVGRAALYDDYHLSQLNTISELLRKGYNSAHIAEFFESIRQGADLADILGLQRAVLGRDAEESERHGGPVHIDPHSEEGRELVRYGMAEVVDGRLMMVDDTAAEILDRAPDPALYIRALVRFVEGAQESVDALAEAFVTNLTEVYHARVGVDRLPRPEDSDVLRQVIEDYRALGDRVMAVQFAKATRRHMVASASGYTAGILLDGAWQPRRGA
ncbi:MULTISPECIES: MerR family transcriptional regulator [Mycolicibacterium]|uniref:Transcriptional regulator, MerR family n=2 Tax=Mycolicibacterium gilvum TaxID=1804 RepID=E6TCW7_MYCSR|nr:MULTISPECIES: MerR family transcriptional regulator [Mycolicibacterium]ADT98619.1 transcriptional regulator, MerR family [Mycolicibacterium gilvum Spyr1]MBV5243043.1 MerR family transcriptional regulator [Mycolicibacterium sp. PAM1]MCV7056993.1 MerR family transcriptional regulator [Mycolicibacterium gilvum]STZ44682.1 MerR family transcriptional regulator [Mycolicibacterium gilvum]